MVNMEELVAWIDNYDDYKYPQGIYHDLVVKEIDHPNKMILMGAWKTGSIRIIIDGDKYIGSNNIRYGFTNRWKPTARVGYEVWEYINRNQKVIKNQIPKEFPEAEPAIVSELKSKRGFGFIWTLFVLHCYYPRIYPLYDQHVYRAYIYLNSNVNLCPNLAPDSWEAYSNYRDFFNSLLSGLRLEFWQLDRGLWAYGKHLKQINKGNKGRSKIKNDDIKSRIPFDEHDWISTNTLGGKSKIFWWTFNEDCSIHIRRKFKNSSGYNTKSVKFDELVKLNDYVNNKSWIDLANNVEKLHNKTEKDGLGTFFNYVLKWSVLDSQLASHLGAIFTASGAWESNGQQRGIQFKKNVANWVECIKEYYYSELSGE